MKLRARWRELRPRLTPRVLWDLLMVYLAFLNLGLILFDLTYLWLRPFYSRTVPPLVSLYDPVKGIEPHPLTSRYLEIVDRLAVAGEAGSEAEVESRLAELRNLSSRLESERPFERSGQEANLIRMRLMARGLLEAEPGSETRTLAEAEVLGLFWSAPPGSERLAERVRFFETRLRPLMAVNYHRDYDLDGQLVDRFWMLDLPFLTLFAIEFFARWLVAIRRRSFHRWFFFPILNWYDLLGIVPLREFRLFRLFRIASIYLRLRRSDLTGVGDDFISRTVSYFANIISEEVSDMVSLRILNETQSEIRDGTHRRIVRSVIGRHRQALAAELARRAGDLFQNAAVRERARELLDSHLERSVDSAEALRRLPVPNKVLRPLVSGIGEVVFEAVADTVAATLESDEGRQALEAVIADAVDGVVGELTDEGELDRLISEISLEILEQVKEAVSVRKWALPDRPPRRLFPSDLGSR